MTVLVALVGGGLAESPMMRRASLDFAWMKRRRPALGEVAVRTPGLGHFVRLFRLLPSSTGLVGGTLEERMNCPYLVKGRQDFSRGAT
jgi:hypothetical protein